MSDIKRGQAAAHLPPEVAVRVIAHRVADRHVAVEAVEGQPGTYEMVPDRDGSGQLAAYEFATRMVNRAFVDSEASGGTAPTGDEDASWSIQFSFQRTPEAAAWDQRIFDCGNVLFQAMRAKEKDKLGRDKGWLTSSLRSTNKTLAELHRHTGNPAIGAAINLVNSFIDETPQGAKAAARQGRATTAYTSERSRMVGRMAAAVMLDLLDLGNDRLTQRPGHPGSDADLRDWRHLWLVRNTCLVALALKEDRTLPKLGHPDEDSMSRTLLIGAAGLRDLSDEDDSGRASGGVRCRASDHDPAYRRNTVRQRTAGPP